MRSEITKREEDIIKLISDGLTNSEIAKIMDINENTVKVHISHILNKLGLNNRRQIVAFYFRKKNDKDKDKDRTKV